MKDSNPGQGGQEAAAFVAPKTTPEASPVRRGLARTAVVFNALRAKASTFVDHVTPPSGQFKESIKVPKQANIPKGRYPLFSTDGPSVGRGR